MAIKAMTMFWLGDETPKKLAVYTLGADGVVTVDVLESDAATLANEPMEQGLMDYNEDTGANTERVYPEDGEKFLHALIYQGQRLSYYDYKVDRS